KCSVIQNGFNAARAILTLKQDFHLIRSGRLLHLMQLNRLITQLNPDRLSVCHFCKPVGRFGNSITVEANMLNRTDTSADSPPHDREYGGPGLFDVALGFLRRHYLVIIVTAALGLVTSFVLLRGLPPVYTAQAKVLVVSTRAPVVQPQLTADEPSID